MTRAQASRRPLLRLTLLLALTLGTGACATSYTPPADPDPWKSANQVTFQLNEDIDYTILEPVAKGWNWVLPDVVQTGVTNFFLNLWMPRTFVNNLLQAKPVDALEDVGRFAVNSTVGLLGLIDVATRIGLEDNEEDFGQTLGVWGMPPGPYVVVPFFGPSTTRDVVGLPFDIAMSPTWYIANSPFGVFLIELLNRRAGALEEILQSRAEAIDWYQFVRDAYLQNREAQIRDGEPLVDQDLYDLDGIE
jgi:phospholipid-binding lipoprotein MlaA